MDTTQLLHGIEYAFDRVAAATRDAERSLYTLQRSDVEDSISDYLDMLDVLLRATEYVVEAGQELRDETSDALIAVQTVADEAAEEDGV